MTCCLAAAWVFAFKWLSTVQSVSLGLGHRPDLRDGRTDGRDRGHSDSRGDVKKIFPVCSLLGFFLPVSLKFKFEPPGLNLHVLLHFPLRALRLVSHEDPLCSRTSSTCSVRSHLRRCEDALIRKNLMNIVVNRHVDVLAEALILKDGWILSGFLSFLRRFDLETMTLSLFVWMPVNNLINEVLNMSIVKRGQSSYPPTER